MNQSDQQHLVPPARFAFIQAAWHADIVDQARQGFVAEMARLGFAAERIDCYEVPGVFEIPLHAKRLARAGQHAAIVGCGFVVDGGIYRHEFVSDTVVRALMQVQLETDVPVLSAVLTPKNFHEHDEHRRFFREHFVVKGTEAAQAAVKTVASLQKLAAATATA